MAVCQETPTSTKISRTSDASGPSQPVSPNQCNTEANSQVKSGKNKMISYSMDVGTGHTFGLREAWRTSWDLYYKDQ